MNTFESKRMENKHFKIKGLKFAVPFTIIRPLKIDANSKVVVFMNGLNGDRAWLKYFNGPAFDNNFLISFDQKGQSKNQERPSQFYRRLINYNLKVLEYIFQSSEFKGRDIILTGESWGANCSLLMSKKRPDLIKGFVIWNMPGKLPSKNPLATKEQLSSVSFKTFFTLITCINTKSMVPFDERLTSNNLLIRASRYNKSFYSNNKIAIAIFFSLSPSWKIIMKNNLKVPFTYIQSMEDIMIDEKKLNKIRNNTNVVVFEKGRHILSLEKESIGLGNEIQKFILSL